MPLPCAQLGVDDSQFSEDCLSMILYVPPGLTLTSAAPTLVWYVYHDYYFFQALIFLMQLQDPWRLVYHWLSHRCRTRWIEAGFGDKLNRCRYAIQIGCGACSFQKKETDPPLTFR